MKEAFVIPRKGLIVRNPTSKEPLPAKGFVVPLTGKEGTYWRRRLACGDVSVAVKQKPAKKKEG